MANIKREWFGVEAATCLEQTGNRITSYRLTLESFKGLFLIAGISSLFSLIVLLAIFLYDNKEIMSSDGSIIHKLTAISKNFDQHTKKSKDVSKKTILPPDQTAVSENMVPENDFPHSPAISIFITEKGFLLGKKDFSVTEPVSPIREIEIVGTGAEEEIEIH